MSCSVCKAEGQIDNMDPAALHEISVFAGALKNRLCDAHMVKAIMDALGWMYTRKEGYICLDCRAKVNQAIDRHYKYLEKELKKILKG